MLRVSLLLDRWIHFLNLHIDPALPLGARRKLLRTIAEDADRCQDTVVIGGDFNFVAGGDARERLDEGKQKEDEGMNGLFDDLFGRYAEMAQQEMSFRRLPRASGGAVVFSRIVRLYTNIHFAALSQFTLSTGVRGAFLAPNAPSDHRAVIMSIRPKRLPPAPRVDGRVCSADAFCSLVTRELAFLEPPRCDVAFIEVLRNAMLSVAPQVRLTMLSSAILRNAALAEICLRALRCGARGRWDQSCSQLVMYSELADIAQRPQGEMQLALQLRLRTYVDANALQSLREVEHSRMPDHHKASKRNAIRLRQEHVRLRRRRHVLDGIYDDSDNLILDPLEAGRAISRGIGSRCSPKRRRTFR